VKFSILTPSYNSVNYIERAIKSVQTQGYTNWEHIVVDGASTDGTIEIIKKYKHLQWVSEPDKGQSDAMNKAFKKSTGDIIIYLNADDELRPGALENYKITFEANPGYDMVVASLEIDNCGVKSVNSPSINLRQVLNYWPCIFPANPVSYAYKKELQTKIGSFPIDNHYTMDYWFLLRAFLKGKIFKQEFTAGTFYFDGLNKSADPENSRKCLKEVRDHFLASYFYRPEVAKFIIRKYIK
jgi:glycosyltransferase involved in cell wall biosynthesis